MLRPAPTAKLRLFCLPFAGGSASAYNDWSPRLPETVQLCAVQLPGRETRFAEPLIDRMDEMVSLLARELAGELDMPYVLYGHSMGASIGFELTRHFRRIGMPQPVHLLVGARDAPSRTGTQNRQPMLHEMPDAVLIRELASMAGSARTIFDNAELMNLMLPIYRADLALIAHHRLTEEAPLDCPITAFGGSHDTAVSIEALQEWGVHTRAGFELRMVDGGHFFMRDSVASFLPVLLERIAPLTA